MKRKAEGGVMKVQLGSEIGEAAPFSFFMREAIWHAPDVNLQTCAVLWEAPAVPRVFRTDRFGQFLNRTVDRKLWGRIGFLAFRRCRAIHVKRSNHEL